MYQYDDSAFYFFALTTTSIYLVPAWYGILSRLYRAIVGVDLTSRTSQEKAALEKEMTGLALFKKRRVLINLFVTLFTTGIFIYLTVLISRMDNQGSSFDPFCILGIEPGANAKEVSNAFRTLSKKWHPDKNRNNPDAASMFMLIKKAKDALTDETAMENWIQFGNPDGSSSLELGLGLPSFLVDKEYRYSVLMTYLIAVVVVIPYTVWRYYSNSSQFGEGNVKYDTYAWYNHTLSKCPSLKSLPEILGGSAEFRSHSMDSSEEQEIKALLSKMRSRMPKPKYNHPICIENNTLLHAHLLRKTDDLSERLQEQLKYMLHKSDSLLDAMISVCRHQGSLQTVMNCIEFGQCLAQACWTNDSTLLQLPHFTSKQVAQCKKGKKKVTNIQEYRALPNDGKKGLADFTSEQRQDVLNALRVIPDISVNSQVFCDDDEDSKVYEEDLVTVAVTITRNNLVETGLVHAPTFPYPIQEAWWIILASKEGKIVDMVKVYNANKLFTHQIKFLAPPPGDYEFDLYIKSNAYVGLDQTSSIRLTTLDNSLLPEYKAHPNDAILDDAPTLFEAACGNIEEDSDSDDDDDLDNERMTMVGKRNVLLRAQRAAANENDDSDEE